MRNGTCHIRCVISWRQNQRERLHRLWEHVAFYCHAALSAVKVQNIDFVCKIPVKECLCHSAKFKSTLSGIPIHLAEADSCRSNRLRRRAAELTSSVMFR